MLRIGLIGCGFMGKMHLACYLALNENVEVCAVADIDESRAADFAGQTGADIYSNGEDLIANADADVFDICLPTYLHAQHAIQAMRKGKAIFIEKPVCLNNYEAKMLIDVQKETGARVMVGQCIRLWSEYAWLKETIVSGEYGKVVSGVFKRVSPLPTWASNNWLHKPECSGTVALDLHIHDVDYIRYILGEPQKISSFASRDKDGVIQQIFTTYDYGMAMVTAEGAWDYPSDFPFCMEYRVKLEKATVTYSSANTPSLVVYPVEGGVIVPGLEKDFEGDNSVGGNISSLGGYYKELKYFTSALINNTSLDIAPLSEGVESLALALKEIEIAGGSVQK